MHWTLQLLIIANVIMTAWFILSMLFKPSGTEKEMDIKDFTRELEQIKISLMNISSVAQYAEQTNSQTRNLFHNLFNILASKENAPKTRKTPESNIGKHQVGDESRKATKAIRSNRAPKSRKSEEEK